MYDALSGISLRFERRRWPAVVIFVQLLSRTGLVALVCALLLHAEWAGMALLSVLQPRCGCGRFDSRVECCHTVRSRSCDSIVLFVNSVRPSVRLAYIAQSCLCVHCGD